MIRSTNHMRQTLFVLFTILTFGLSAQSIVNNSLSFDGIDDHLVVEGSPDIATIDHPSDISYTLEAWIKLDAETNETIMLMGTGNEGNHPELNESIFIFNVSKNLLGVNLGGQTGKSLLKINIILTVPVAVSLRFPAIT